MFKKILDATNLLLWEKEVDLCFPSEAKRIDFDIKSVERGTCQKIASQNNWQANFSSTIDEILDQSDICFVASKNEKMVHWTHIAFRRTHIAEIRKTIQADLNSAYLFGIFTLKEFRKRGITTVVLERVLAYLAERGTKKAYILVDSHNSSMNRLLAKIGFKIVGKVKFIKISKLELYQYRGKTKEKLLS